MSGTKEAELITAVLLYAIRCLAEGDQHALRSMNFGPEETDALRGLCVQDLYRADTMQAHCLEIRLNRQVYWPLIAHLRDSRESETVQQDLIRAGAPSEMMQSLFGMGAREYTRHRRQTVADVALGRPPEPDDVISHKVYHAWSARAEAASARPMAPSDYLAIHEETGASLRAIWTLTERWRAYGGLDADAPPTMSSGADARP